MNRNRGVTNCTVFGLWPLASRKLVSQALRTVGYFVATRKDLVSNQCGSLRVRRQTRDCSTETALTINPAIELKTSAATSVRTSS
jgi:hypothetical protein